jgi:hypothetical protein
MAGKSAVMATLWVEHCRPHRKRSSVCADVGGGITWSVRAMSELLVSVIYTLALLGKCPSEEHYDHDDATGVKGYVVLESCALPLTREFDAHVVEHVFLNVEGGICV